jgi:tRNA C32,U32 (ribose-2'-O)-methylase TrmJ
MHVFINICMFVYSVCACNMYPSISLCMAVYVPAYVMYVHKMMKLIKDNFFDSQRFKYATAQHSGISPCLSTHLVQRLTSSPLPS